MSTTETATIEFLQEYFELRKQQSAYFKTRSKAALIYCKESEPKLDEKAQQLYQQMTQPELFNP